MTEAAVKVVECVRQMRGRYGLRVVAGTLSGENTAKLKEYRVSEYPAFASLNTPEGSSLSCSNPPWRAGAPYRAPLPPEPPRP